MILEYQLKIQKGMKKDMLYEKLAKEILGEDLFDDTLSFFEEIFERNSEFKIILTRRCFSLFKIFREILKDRLTNQHGCIITDNNIELYFSEIQKAIEFPTIEDAASVIIADDIIIYGRTISGVISNISYGLNEDYLQRIRAICMAKNSGSFIEKKYENLIFPRKGVSPLKWKEISNKFSRLIKATDKSNTSYTVSCHFSISNESDVMKAFLDFCENEMFMPNQPELEQLNIKSYVINAFPQVDAFDFCDNISGLVRVYLYNDLNTIQISPLLILNNMDEKNIDKVLGNVVDALCDRDDAIKKLIENKNQNLYKIKMRMLTMLLSQVLLFDFLQHHGLNCDSYDQYDYKEIIEYNFSSDYLNSFRKLNATLHQLKSKSKLQYFNYNIEEIAYSQEFDDLVFEKAMEDNAAARSESGRIDGFNVLPLKEVSLFSKNFSANLMTLLDSGRAALKIIFDNGMYCSMIFSGEQAFRIMNDQFVEFLPSLNLLEENANLCNKYSYDLYRKFLSTIKLNSQDLLTDVQYNKFVNYIDILENNGQQISDVMCLTFVACNKKKIEQIDELLKAYIKDEFNG